MNGNAQPATLPTVNGAVEQMGISMARKRYQNGSVKLRGKSWEFRWREDVIVDDKLIRRLRRYAFATKDDYATKKLAVRDTWVVNKLAELNSLSYRPSTVITFSQFATKWTSEVLSQMEPSTGSADRSRIGIRKPKKDSGGDRADRHCNEVSAREGATFPVGQAAKPNSDPLSFPELEKSPRRKLPTLLALLGEQQLKDIDTRVLQLVVKALADAGAQAKTIKNYIATLRTMWATAKAWSYVTHHPFEGIVLPEAAPPEVPFYPEDVQFKIIESAKEPYRTIWWFASETGIRRSEICALRMSDMQIIRVQVNAGGPVIEQGIVTVRRKVWNGIVGPTKSKRPRVFSLSPELTAHLKLQTEGRAQEALMFTNENGGMLCPDELVKRHLKPVLEKLGVAGGMHAFRHGNATELDRRGVPMAVRQSRLGHMASRTTMGYTHLVSQDELEASRALGRTLAPAAEGTA